MTRIFIVIMLAFLFSYCDYVNAVTLKTGIIYNVNIARQEAFEDTPKYIDIEKYKEYKYDLDRINNLEAAKNQNNKYKGKIITLFSDGDYSLKYRNESFFYNVKGDLVIISIQNSTRFPIKSMRYDVEGNLDSISLSISEKEQYIFDAQGNLKAHWIGNNCYNEKGQLIMTRK